MTLGIFLGTGDAARAAEDEINRAAGEYLILCEDRAVLDRCRHHPASRPIQGFNETALIPTLRAAQISAVSFVGHFPEMRLIDLTSMQTVQATQGSTSPPAVLSHLVMSLKSVGIAIRSIAEEFVAFGPGAEHHCSQYPPEKLEDCYHRAVAALKAKAAQVSHGWASGCLVGPDGFIRLPTGPQNTAELVGDFVKAGLFGMEDVFLCRHSPWNHASIRRPTIGVETIALCHHAGISGLLADRSQVVVFDSAETAVEAVRRRVHLQYF